LGSTQPLTGMSTRDISWGKGSWCALFKSKKFFIATHPSYLSGPMDTKKKSRYSSPVDHRSLDDLSTSTVHTNCHKSCARYMLGVRYLYFKRNAEKFGVCVIRNVRAIGWKIR
jgi:hypothetical protein